jgi:hypothetical protein
MMSLLKKTLSALLVSLSLGAIAFAAGVQVTVYTSPTVTAINAGTTQQFYASVSGGGVPYYSWSISGSGCSGTACGSINQSGLYTAPKTVSSPLLITVSADAILNGVTGSTTLTVNPVGGTQPISVAVNPKTATVAPSGQQTFTATVSNTTNQSVVWSVTCATTSCGSVNGSGVFTAPSSAPSPNSIAVTATSLADSTKSGSAMVTVGSSGTVTVSISPSINVQVATGAPQTFTATVTGSTNQTVTWSVSGTGCSGSACGTITTGGVYTAPSTLPSPASVTVTATSQANTSSTASVSITLTQAGQSGGVAVSISPQNAQVTAGTKQQMTATVTGTTNTAVTWSISGSGSINTSGLYTAPAAANVSSPLTVTVTAKSKANPTISGSTTLTVVLPVVITVTPASATLSVGATQQFSATVTGASNPSLTWSAIGTGCSGVSCGTVTANGNSVTYTSPSAVPNPASVSLVASLNSNPSQTGSAAITIAPLNNGLLTGQYAFLFKGFDPAGPYQAAGTFTADGNGNLTAGVEDINCGASTADPQCASGPVVGQTFTGTYTLNSDDRGTFSFNGATFAMALTPSGAKCKFIESDNSGIQGSGILELQTPSAFNNSAFSGSGFAIGLSGVDSAGAPIAAIGGLDLQSSGGTSTVQGTGLDVNDNGQLSCYPAESRGSFACSSAGTTRFSGTYNVGSNGRGPVNLTIPGFGSQTYNYTIYVISSSEFFLFSTDDASINPVMSGQGLEQQMVTNSFSFFQKGYSVFDWNGAPNGVYSAVVGRMEFDGAGNIIDLGFDQNNGGAITIGEGVGVCSARKGACTYSSEFNGEVYLNFGFGTTSAAAPMLLYPTSANSGFLLGEGSTVLFGKTDAQAISPPQSFAFGTDLMISPAASVISGTGSFSGTDSLVGNEDESLTSGFMGNLAWDGMYGPTSLNGGTATMYLTSPTQQTVVFFVVSFNKMVGIDIDSTVVNPTVINFQQ